MALYGRYEYAGELGQGVSGRVFAVRDLSASQGERGAKRAIKVLVGGDSGRLLWEFARLGQVDHPRLARVRELLRLPQAAPAPFALPAGALLLVQDFVEGAPLSLAVTQAEPAQRLTLAARAGVAVAEALCALHERSLVHGDVKPDNVICGPGGEGATLIDLGFARPPELSGQARGTPAFMAPEAFAGVCTPAADVYALGALIFDMLRGDPVSAGSGSGGAPFQPRDLSQIEPLALRRVLDRLLATDRLQRPADGPAALALLLPCFAQLGVPLEGELARPAPRYASLGVLRSPREEAARVRTLPFLGHERALSALVAALEHPGLVVLPGPRGSGRSRLVREALRALQERRASAGAPVPTWVSSLEALAGLRDIDVVLWLEQPVDQRELARATAAAKLALRSLSVVMEAHDQGARGESCIELRPLSEERFDELLARVVAERPSAALSKAAREASEGLSGRLCELAATLALAGRDLRDPRAWQAVERAVGAPRLSAPTRELARALAWYGADLQPQHAQALLGEAAERAYDELRAAGLLRSLDGALQLDEALARELRGEARPRRLSITPREGFSLLLHDQPDAALAAFLARARSLRARGRSDAACAVLSAAAPFLEDEALRALWADSERARGRYLDGLHVLRGQGDATRLLRAELLRLCERPSEARVALQGIASPPHTLRAAALRARMELDDGDLAAAESSLAEARGAADGDLEAEARAVEVEALLVLMRGEPSEQVIEALSRALTRDAPVAAPSFLLRAPARQRALRSQLHARRGERLRALADARAAVEHARALGEAHEAATYALNLGLLELERGELGLALETLRDAAQRLARVARTRDLARVLFNVAALALLVGDLTRAEVVLEDAERELTDVADPLARSYVALLRSELCVARGALEQAEQLLQGVEAPPGGARVIVSSRLAQVALARGGEARAREALERARAEVVADKVARLEREAAELRLSLAEGDIKAAEARAERNLGMLEPGLPFADRLRFLLVTIESARASGSLRALAERSALARAELEAALGGLSAELRASMRAVPAYARVLASSEYARAEPPATSERWRGLVRASRRLFAETRTSRVAARLCEIALELVHAERALVIYFDARGEPSVHARRELSGEGRGLGFSRSVLEQVALDGRPLLTVEAGSDARLERAQSVAALQVRSVLCGELIGLRARAFLYLDDRLRPSAFSGEDLALIEDLLELGRQALECAEQRTRQARRARRAELSQQRLSRELSRGIELAASGEQPLVGDSPALARVLASARRVAASDAPVLITGESGTGKELLARFVHEASPRKARSFVAQSCAAMPDSLLESELFGHVRGAFTGAERARKGLFELADGGTLFLDEVGEMSPLLQSKLLRVLQEGELRPVGSERTRAVDVRVIGATRRDLRELVQQGSFREDLFYRLAVVSLQLPPLRDRREDIPRLVSHFLHKHGGTREPLRIQPAALRALELRDWPGNVRELENELRRALALSEGEIELTHLSAAEPVQGETALAELDLHAHTERLTRRLVRDALALSDGNVTRAAALLGVSRFGLQKILKRLQLSAK